MKTVSTSKVACLIDSAILARLKAAHEAKRFAHNKSSREFYEAHTEFWSLVKLCSKQLGAYRAGDHSWHNRAIAAIDKAYPDWRGEVVEVGEPMLIDADGRGSGRKVREVA